MEQLEIETRIRNIDERTQRIEQILPTLASREEVKGCVTRDELVQILKTLATKDDLKAFATKDDLKAFASKDDLKAYPTRDEMMALMHEEGERTRRHFDIVAEQMDERFKLMIEGRSALEARLGAASSELRADIDAHDKRITRLEADASRRR